MWTRSELKAKAKASFKLNYWKTVLIALIVLALSGAAAATGAANGSAAGGSAQRYAFDPEHTSSTYTITEDMSEEEIQEMFEELYGDSEVMYDEDASVEELVNMYDFNVSIDDQGGHFEVGPGGLFVVASVGMLLLVIIAVALAIDALVVNPILVGTTRFFLRNLNQPALVAEAGYGFDNNYRENAKTMFMRDIRIFGWALLLIIPGIVKAYEYRMIPYLLADDPTMTCDRAFAESKRMMQGNKWNAFVLDLSFIGWNLLSLHTLGILSVFYVGPYQQMTNAALYEKLRYGTPDPQMSGYSIPAPAETLGQVPVPPFAEEGGFAPESPEA